MSPLNSGMGEEWGKASVFALQAVKKPIVLQTVKEIDWHKSPEDAVLFHDSLPKFTGLALYRES
jgi:hypothetical protein